MKFIQTGVEAKKLADFAEYWTTGTPPAWLVDTPEAIAAMPEWVQNRLQY